MIRFILISFLSLMCLPGYAQLNGDVKRDIVRGGNGGGNPSNSYMLIVDAEGRKIIGNSNTKDKKEFIPISGFTQKSWIEEDEQTGALTENTIHGKVKVTKMADESSPILMEMLDTRQKAKRIDIIIFNKDKDGAENEAYKLRLEGVQIQSIQSQLIGQSPRLGPTTVVKETILLTYDRISWTLDNGISSYHTESN
ncbi:MAG: type VI secretion system Hcp family effector [Limisphaerales bacterium]|jgi:type VI secretion system Hcp family effector